jgi:U2-associated protein SR140
VKYEANLKERERNNPKYGFLTNKHHRRHAFYRGLVERQEGIDPAFDDDGYNSVYSTDSAEDSERENGRKNMLGKLARKRFEAMLRGLAGKRGELARCMAFSLEHAEAAPEVSDIIVASLLVDGTAVPRKVARLHLICDILHNSAASVPSAWKFRQEFQSRLGIVFDHLGTIYHSFPGRITADTFKKQITSVVDIWEDWIVFPPDFTAELRARLDGTSTTDVEPQNEDNPGSVEPSQRVVTSRFKASTFRPAEEVQETVVSGAASGKDEDGEPMDQDDLDGEPVDDVDGEPLNDDVDGDPIDDVDGEPMDDGGLDGEPIEDDIDGAPIDV